MWAQNPARITWGLGEAQVGSWILPTSSSYMLVFIVILSFLFIPQLLNQFSIAAAKKMQDCVIMQKCFYLADLTSKFTGFPYQLELGSRLKFTDSMKGKHHQVDCRDPQMHCPEALRSWLLGNLPRIHQFSYPILMEQK